MTKSLFENAHIALPCGPDFSAEQRLAADGYARICGVDEVGRGPLAGPVVAAAVILDSNRIPQGLDDSKKLTAKKRKHLALDIYDKAAGVCVAEVSVEAIDQMNILEAAMLAMRNATDGLSPPADAALVDGNRDPGLGVYTETLVKGDARSLSIAAASIVAKVFRDELMAKLGEEYPDYGWGSNAGYGVPRHMEALRLVGVSPHHRKSFAPIRTILNED